MGQEVHLCWESDGESLVWHDGEPVQVRSLALRTSMATFQFWPLEKPQLSGCPYRVIPGFQDWGGGCLRPCFIGPSYTGKLNGWLMGCNIISAKPTLPLPGPLLILG